MRASSAALTTSAFAALATTAAAAVIAAAFHLYRRHRARPRALSPSSSIPAFVVPSGPCAGSYDGVLISTDLEPDDAIALKALAPRLRGVPLLVVLGEGDRSKAAMASGLLAAYGLDGGPTRVVQGRPSSSPYPASAIAAYAPLAAASSAEVVADGNAPAAGEPRRAVVDFLSTCERPFALLLKPPHELVGLPAGLLAKAVGAAYGSFNFVVFRKELRADDPTLTAEAALEAQNALLREMRACLWVERAPAVGRDATLEAGHAEWAAVAADARLTALVEGWNSRTIGECCDSMEAWVARLRGACLDAAPDLGALRALDFEKLDKKAKILRSIVDADGRQTCFADTLVAAALVDDGGALAPYYAKLAPADGGAPTAEPRSSSLSALAADKGAPQKALASAARRVLGAALAADGVLVASRATSDS